MAFIKPRLKILLKVLVLVLLAGAPALPGSAADYEDGFIRLSLDPLLGRFSLYYLSDPAHRKYEALFMDQDPRTSVLSLSYDNRIYRLGESEEFSVSEGGSAAQPTLIFESPNLRVLQEFSFISTGASQAANGIRINFRIENKGRRRALAGLRFLLDTKLGESSTTPFHTNNRMIQEEILFREENGFDAYWISGTTEGPALMGSLAADVDRVPDAVHIANWKRLNDVPWALDLVSGRRFNNPPYSIRDSAVAYYYEPQRINGGDSVSFYLHLAIEDNRGFASARPSEGLPVPPQEAQAAAPALASAAGAAAGGALPPSSAPSPGTGSGGTNRPPPGVNPAIIRSDYNALRDIIDRVEGHLELGARMSDDEISAIEQDLARIRSRYPAP
jgi:hypothetical protein